MRSAALVPVALVVAAQLACHKTVGNVMASTTNDLVLPEAMEIGDVGMGCAAGEGLGGMILAYGDYSKKARQASVLTTLSAAMCLDGPIWEVELELQRALRDGDSVGAKDAQARLGRLHDAAARRYLLAHESMRDGYGMPDADGTCPKLKKEHDELAYLLGMSAGILAVLHDLAANGSVGVPLSIPAEVVRAASCLDDDTWWGAPMAMQASVWALMPDAPGAGDPWATFDASMAKGQQAGVRLPYAFAVQTASVVNQPERLRDGIRAHAVALDGRAPSGQWRMLDSYATTLVRHESDKIWTKLEGHRTPWGELGTFPDDQVEVVPVDPGLLDDLLGE